MASRLCGCAAAQCNCVLEAGNGISVIGAGSPDNPYIITAEEQNLVDRFVVQDTSSIDLTLTGSGTTADPFILSGTTSIALGDITNVDTSDTTAGYVLTRNVGGTFEMMPGSTADPGVIITGDGLEGDGSVGDPLTVTNWGDIGLRDRLIFDTCGAHSFDPTLYPWLTRAVVHVLGAGGSGGGCAFAHAGAGFSNASEGGGGGGGGYAWRFYTAIGLGGSVINLYVGCGGEGAEGGIGTAEPQDGNPGEDSTFGTAITAEGGGGGAAMLNENDGWNIVAAGNAGGATGGNVNVHGGKGGVGMVNRQESDFGAPSLANHGGSGAGPFGGGTSGGAGMAANYGGGTDGASRSGSLSDGTPVGTLDGAHGLIVIELYGN